MKSRLIGGLIMATLAVVLILFFQELYADTVGPGCHVVWEYPTLEESRIDGIRFYRNSVVGGTAVPSAREIACVDVGVESGFNTLTATAYNAVGESAHSEPLTFVFVDTAPAVPENIRIIVSIPP